MLNKNEILELLNAVNAELQKRGCKGEIGIVGGAAMCLVYNARPSTKDVDGVFEPSAIIREVAAEVAAQHTEKQISADWLNDAVKGFLAPGFTKCEVLRLTNLLVWSPEPQYMLAMKCISARWDSHDRDDVIFLIKLLGLKSTGDVFGIIEGYYPKKAIAPKTQFFIEEVLGR